MRLWNGEEDDHEKKWEVLKIIQLATIQNETSDRQLGPSNQAESDCVYLNCI